MGETGSSIGTTAAILLAASLLLGVLAWLLARGLGRARAQGRPEPRLWVAALYASGCLAAMLAGAALLHVAIWMGSI